MAVFGCAWLCVLCWVSDASPCLCVIAAHLLQTLVPVPVLVLGAPRLQTRHVCSLAGLLRFGGCECGCGKRKHTSLLRYYIQHSSQNEVKIAITGVRQLLHRAW